MALVTVGQLHNTMSQHRVIIGSLRATDGHLGVKIGHFRVTLSHLRITHRAGKM